MMKISQTANFIKILELCKILTSAASKYKSKLTEIPISVGTSLSEPFTGEMHCVPFSDSV